MGKSILQVPDTGTRVLGNTKPFWHSSIVCFWMPQARSKERTYHVFGQYWYTRNVPVFTNTGMFQYLGPEVYFFQKMNPMSQSCRAHLFFGARLIQQNSRFEFFLLAYFFFILIFFKNIVNVVVVVCFCFFSFFQFFMDLLVKIYKK